MSDNLVGERYYYQLSVYTGMRKGAGTKSNVRFVLCGDLADTGVRELKDDKRKVHDIHNTILCNVEAGRLVFCNIDRSFINKNILIIFRRFARQHGKYNFKRQT